MTPESVIFVRDYPAAAASTADPHNLRIRSLCGYGPGMPIDPALIQALRAALDAAEQLEADEALPAPAGGGRARWPS